MTADSCSSELKIHPDIILSYSDFLPERDFISGTEAKILQHRGWKANISL
jgi:hypothetical protein